MTTPPLGAPVLIGDFAFDPSTGETWLHSGAADPDRTRLPPQPAKLLELLIHKNGELASREEIRQRLWPDSHVDFDQSVNFCIHQIRSAFHDSGAQPTYIETLPRRGYRLMRPVEQAVPSPPASAEEGAPPPVAPASRFRRIAVPSLVALLVSVGLILLLTPTAPAPSRPVRLAIMPFELAAQAGDPKDLARISEWLVAEFSTGWEGSLEVIGPRSTAPYSTFPFPQLSRLREDLAIDFVINARSFEEDGKQQLLVELIRLDDRSHPWATFFGDTRPWRAIAQEVHQNVSNALRPPP